MGRRRSVFLLCGGELGFFLFIGSALLGGSSVQKWKEDQIFVVNAIGFFCILYIE